MAYVLKLSDSTTTLDLVDGTNYEAINASLFITPPEPRRSTTPPTVLSHGTQLVSQAYENRPIDIGLNVLGTTKDNLIANVQAIEELLEKARHRQLTRYGNRVTLELQWDAATNNVLFDVIDGGFSHGRGFWGRTDLEYGPRLNNTRLRLWCLPFGRRAVVALSSDTLENHQGGANLNYADITGIEGDVDAPCQLKLVPSGASGTAKVWIATRTGTRRTDTLWRQGESRDSFARQYTPRAPEQLVDSTQTIAGTSDGDAQRTRLGRADSRPVTLNRRIYGRWRFAMSGPPKGLFRILGRVKATIVRPNSAAWSNMSFYAGWDAGGLSSTPRLGIDTKKPVADDTWTTIDFGELRIPATTDPDGQTLDAFNVDIFSAYETRGHVTLHYGRADWSIDYLMLLPVDEGVAILDEVTTTDRILLDSESNHPQVYVMDSFDRIQKVANYVGRAPMLSVQDTRLYVLRDDAPAASYALSGDYTPRYWALA